MIKIFFISFKNIEPETLTSKKLKIEIST